MWRFGILFWFVLPSLVVADEVKFDRNEVIYSRKFGTALTMDVFTPAKAGNGAGIIFVVSEGWHSNHSAIDSNMPVYVLPYLAKGYTVFAVCHGSNPKFALPEYVEDMHRAVRFIRHHAKKYGIDAEKLGITGDSAGGHLSLMMGCSGRPGDPKAEDPIDRLSSRVQAVVAHYPPTDFLNWGENGKKMLGNHPVVAVKGAFDFQRLDPKTDSFVPITDANEREKIAFEASPIAHVRKGNSPALIIHGDNDTLVPIQQSQRMAAKMKEAGATVEFITHPGGEHDEKLVRENLPKAMAWFDRHLSPAKTASK